MNLKNESQIRPKDIYNEYLRLVEKDLSLYDFHNHKIYKCPFCNSEKYQPFLSKFNFNYFKCSFCESIYSSERPSSKALNLYYKNSLSNLFWYKSFWPLVKKNRIKYIFNKRVIYILKNKNIYDFNFNKYIDIGCGNAEFLNSFQKKINKKVCGIEPSINKKIANKNINIINNVFEKTKLKSNSITFFTVFELIEHILNPLLFLKKMHRSLSKNGFMIISFTDPTGFELSTLKGKSTQFLPPLHLNFMSIFGCYIILKNIGFKEVNIVSLGELDVDIVKNNYGFKNPNALLKTFINNDLSQKFLKEYNMSSHKWLIAKK
ncbi:methyltransferase domain-containing protein [Alphaproteobacteria bacterium]|jgi:SAM-dependent methyltransferase|nr:methyltransferase domain-containing protein [Alphaproteobacteria bacterium]